MTEFRAWLADLDRQYMAQDPEMPLLLTKVPYYKLHSSWEQGYTPRDAMVRLKLNLD